MPFAQASGVEIVSAEPAGVTGRLAWASERCTVGGVLHGAALMTLADSVGAVCAFLNLPPGATTSTTTSSTCFLAAVRGGVVTAFSRPLQVGRTVVVVRTELFDADDRLVAHVVQTQSVRAAPPAAASPG
ncbi:MAG: PaaI family thioesterase [Actinomycetota bacterium]|nr:PaaI family thioesterase [Actinomycetota bacterium]